MHRSNPPPELIKFLKPYDRAIRELALGLRSLVLEEMGPCYENIYDAYNAVAIGYGSSDRLQDGVFHIAVYANHVNLGFNHGATLDDPLEILKGNGKQIRHITIKSPADLARPEIRSYVRRARKIASEDARKLGESKEKTGKKSARSSGKSFAKTGKSAPSKVSDVISVVKAVYPKRRRPVSKS